MSRRTNMVGLGASVVSVGLALLIIGLESRSDPPEFCHLGQAIVGSSDVETYGDVTILDFSDGARLPCGDNDLWGFRSIDLAGVDGVLFNDCVISWTEGGRTPAAELGMPCRAAG